MFEEVESRRKRLDRHKPFDDALIRRLNKFFEPLFIHGSNALEGNTLTLGDTIYVIEEGRLPGGKREEEYLEVKGQQDAYAYLQHAVTNAFPLSEKLIRELHQLLTGKLDAEKYRPGQYKDRENQVRLPDGSLFPYASFVETPSAMQDLVDWYRGDGQVLHPIERAAWLHYKFILIHPFRDGNGRTARILVNLVLMQAGYSMAIFRADERRPLYLGALRAVDSSVPREELSHDNPRLNLFPLASHLEQELLWSYDQALDIVEGRLAVDANDLVAAFSRLETKALGALQPVLDEEARRERMSRSVITLHSRVQEFLAPIVNETNASYKLFEMSRSAELPEASKALDSSQPAPAKAWLRRAALGLGDAPPSGQLGWNQLAIRKQTNAPAQLQTPQNGIEFLVYAEPHSLILATLITGIYGPDRPSTDWSSSIRFPLDPDAWRQTELERFMVKELQRFRGIVEFELERLNASLPTS
jgi:fido (protein-threonine AMPylation protein)